MSEPSQSNSTGPKLSWHLLNAALCTGLWWLAFALGIAMVLALSPQAWRESKVMALVPFLLLLVFSVGAMFFASIRASRRTTEVRPED